MSQGIQGELDERNFIDLSICPNKRVQIDRVCVFGERRSGTNLAETLFAKNLGIPATRKFGWKHGVPSYPVLPAQCLYIVVVRHPLDWAQSFHKAPYESHPSLQSLTFSEFVRVEWRAMYKPGSAKWDLHGFSVDRNQFRRQELQADRHPLTGKRFENVFKMRNIKLQSHLSLLNRELSAVVVRYEDIVRDRKAVLEAVLVAFDFPIPKKIMTFSQKIGPQAYGERQKEAISEEDVSFARANLDLQQEKRCGYAI